MNIKKLHMIGHGHIDPVWLWQWQEGFQEVKATFRSALDRMEEYDDFKFISSSAVFYKWIENNDPQMFEEIKERVQEGRWEIVGGWWVEPDCNIPCGESFVRHALYSQKYFQEKFGKKVKVAFNPDSFGHNGMLPQILQKSGFDYYMFMRPGPHEKDLPGNLFVWQAKDGSSVLCYRIPFSYNTRSDKIEERIQQFQAELDDNCEQLMCFYGVGNHGGGPTKANIENIFRLQDDNNYPELIFSTPEKYFTEIETEIEDDDLEIPVVTDDLQHHASGCYAVHSGIKKWNRKAENLLLESEKLSTLAHLVTGQSYPEDYHRAWKNVLFNQFHDILAGTSIKDAYDDARNSYGEAMSIADRGLNYAVQSLAWNINIEEIEGMRPIVVFNPHSWKCEVEVEIELEGLKGKTLEEDKIRLLDEKDRGISVQLIQSQATVRGKRRICFIASLPAFGYRTYKLLAEPAQESLQKTSVNVDNYSLENDKYQLDFDPETGYIVSLYDKVNEMDVFSGPAARPVVIQDESDTWSHGVFKFKDEIGSVKANEIKIIEQGPVKAVMRVISNYGNSELIQDFTIYAEKDIIKVSTKINWQEQFKMLKLKFPVNKKITETEATYEIPYGYIVREADGEEEPGQNWIDLSGKIKKDERTFNETISTEKYGLSIINDAKYSYDISDNEMSLTVLRSPIYAHHDPVEPDPEVDYEFIDQGFQEFNYYIYPHTGDWREAGTVKKSLELNQSPAALVETYHEGSLPQKNSYLTVDKDNIIVSVIKKVEDNNDIIIRCFESVGKATKAEIKFPEWNREIVSKFNPCEIKTFLLPEDGRAVQETNLVEENV